MSRNRSRSFPITGLLAALMVTCCTDNSADPVTSNTPQTTTTIETNDTPPPLPEGQKTVIFEDPAATIPTSTETAAASPYWGIAPGDPLPIMWHDLMPEGAEEELLRQQDEFYRMLEQRYRANTTRLADAAASTIDSIEEGSELDYMPQFGNFDVVEELDGQLIRIPGYVVPFDFNLSRKHEAFLFVPYMGACIHTPPPPPNQIIYVRADPAVRIKDIWEPYWLEGDLQGEEVRNDTGDAAYSLTLTTIDPYRPPQ